MTRGTMNGKPMGWRDELPPGTAELRETFADVDRACTKWLLEHDPVFKRSHEYFDRASGNKRNKGFAI